MFIGAVLLEVWLLVWMVWSKVYGICAGGSVAIFECGVIKCLCELCCWVFGYCWGWCDQMFMGAV